MERRSERGLDSRRVPIFLLGLRRALVRPAAWITGAAGLAALALPLGLSAGHWFGSTIPGHYEPGEQTHSLSAAFRTDHADGLSVLWDTLSAAGAWLAALAFLFGVFTAGGWLGTLVDTSRTSSTRRYFHGGVRYFWRFLRLALLFLVLLDLGGRVLLGELWEHVVQEDWMGWRDGDPENARSELAVRRLVWLQHGTHALLFAFLFVWATYARVRIVLQSQASAVAASLRTLLLLLRHPIQTFRPLAILFALDFLVLLGLGLLVDLWLQAGLADNPSGWRVGLIWSLSILVLLVRELFDGARYAAALGVSERVVRPLRPDPWKDRIGAPGGPQYPISDEDEFQISM